MSSTIIALMLLVALTGIITILIYIHIQQHKKEKQQLLHLFSVLGSSYHLSFSAKEIFTHAIIGLDGLHRKLLYMEATTRGKHQFIDLEEVKSCTLEKTYTGYLPASKRFASDTQVQDIGLLFHFKKEKEPLTITFYNFILHNIYLREELEIKAKEWQIILSKMLMNIKEKRA